MDQTFFHSLDNLMHQIKTLVKFIGHFFFWTKLSEIRIQIQLCPDYLDSTATTQPQFF